MPDPIFLSGDQVPDYLRGVELMTAGMEWPASTGPVTITLEHIADAIVAANDDPHIQVPRIKLGHSSPLNGAHPDHDPFAAIGDAEPAFGQFVNLGAANDGAVLTGDADNIVVWLAESAPATYPNRSAEATWAVDTVAFDVQTPGGRRYSMVVTAVALLGVYIPAIGDLEDLTTLIMEGPAAVTARQPSAAAAAAQMSVSYDTVRDRFNWSWAFEREDNETEHDTTWWWARDVRFDPNEVIADDDSGNLWSVPFTTDGEDHVSFGEPARVRQTYVPVAATTVASFSRPNKRTDSRAASTAAPERPDPEGGASMDDDVREVLVGRGLDPDTATEEQIQAATVIAAIGPPAGAGTDDDAAGSGGDASADGDAGGSADAGDTDNEGAAGETREPVAASRQLPEGTTIIDADELARLRAGSEAGARLAAEQATRERDRVIFAARDEGRFPPSRVAHYTRLYDTDPEGTRTLLTAEEAAGGLAKGTVPLAARAEIPGPEGDTFAADEPLPSTVSLLNPSERAALRARRAI